jgi:hypothetical protein
MNDTTNLLSIDIAGIKLSVYEQDNHVYLLSEDVCHAIKVGVDSLLAFCLSISPFGQGSKYVLLDDAVEFWYFQSRISNIYAEAIIQALVCECLERRVSKMQEKHETSSGYWIKHDRMPFIARQNIIAEKKTSRGYIYLLESTSSPMLKLGFTTHVKNRIKSLSRWDGELTLITKKRGYITEEQGLHRKLRSTGKFCGDEWYPLERKSEIIALINFKQITPDQLVEMAINSFE